MVMQGHICCDVFDMCRAHRALVWLKPQHYSRKSRWQTSPAWAATTRRTQLGWSHRVTDVKRQECNCSLFTRIKFVCEYVCVFHFFVLSVTHQPSGGVIWPTPPGDRE